MMASRFCGYASDDCYLWVGEQESEYGWVGKLLDSMRYEYLMQEQHETKKIRSV